MKNQPLISALAEGFRDGGVELSFNYPGFHSNELHEALGGEITSVNERTAYACGWGASLAGARVVVSLKNVGLNDAADPFLNSIVLGCNGGLVLALFDDCDAQHSQNRMDSRHYFDFFGGLWIDPISVQGAYLAARDSLSWSERFSTPVVIRVTNILYNRYERHTAQGAVLPQPSPQFSRDPQRWVIHPRNAQAQEIALAKRREAICSHVETLEGNGVCGEVVPAPPKPLSIIYGAKRDINADAAVRAFTLPLPERRLTPLICNRGGLVVHEHGSPFVAEKIQALVSGTRVRSALENNLRLRFKHHNSSDAERLFGAIRCMQQRVVIGDLGGYTMDPERTIDACLCYGASVPVAMGFAAVAGQNARVFAVTGDAAFIHGGRGALWEARQRNAPMTIIVFDNGGARGTGGQAIPGGVEDLPACIPVTRCDYNEMTVESWQALLEKKAGQQHLVIVKTLF